MQRGLTAKTERRKVYFIEYTNLYHWKQSCLPMLLFGRSIELAFVSVPGALCFIVEPVNAIGVAEVQREANRGSFGQG